MYIFTDDELFDTIMQQVEDGQTPLKTKVSPYISLH